MQPDPLGTPRTCSARLVPSALVYQASHYRGAYWLIAHWPPQKNSTQHATAIDFEHSALVISFFLSLCYSL
jgi:hypothetical protein